MRIYGRWNWEPTKRHTREDTTRCVVEVASSGAFGTFRQCLKKRGYGKGGLFCAQHAHMVINDIHVDIPEDRG